jgi:hypothetical protein
VIGGYSPDGVDSLDAVLVGYYEGRPYSSPAKGGRGWCPSSRVSRSSVHRMRSWDVRFPLDGSLTSLFLNPTRQTS